MPLFDFSCLSCHYVFEKICGAEQDYPACPLCGGETDKIMGAPVAHFKGKGFHCTDYNSKKRRI
jgi:putative FmdB family regulatory protein